MTSNRTYRRALTRGEAFEELRRCSGTQFESRIVEAVLATVGEEN